MNRSLLSWINVNETHILSWINVNESYTLLYPMWKTVCYSLTLGRFYSWSGELIYD